jgi:hypothetical protein
MPMKGKYGIGWVKRQPQQGEAKVLRHVMGFWRPEE